MRKSFVTDFRGEFKWTPREKINIKNEPVTPEEFFENIHCFDQPLDDNIFGALKRSLSMSDITALKDDLKNLDLNQFNEEAVLQRYRKRSHVVPKTKFVSMAEGIYHYQRDTPRRFRSRPKFVKAQTNMTSPGLTVPQSPMLRCKGRTRPLHTLSQKEREEMEVEEMKKYKIKANPVPKSVVEGSKNLPEIPKKPATVPEPFKLTQVSKKPMNDSPVKQKFKARPVPKHVLGRTQVQFKLTSQVAKKMELISKHSKSADDIRDAGINSKQFFNIRKPKIIQPVKREGPFQSEPFSFEKRDEELKRKHEEKIKKVIEEERKLANNFKAKPIPGAVKARMHKIVGCSSKSSSSATSVENKENKFEARLPVVLYKPPFRPVLENNRATNPDPFDLNTEKRAIEREQFDKQLKKREEEKEKHRQQLERERQEMEKKMNAKLRAQLVHHAKPALKKSPFVPHKSEFQLTMPETPQLLKRQTKLK